MKKKVEGICIVKYSGSQIFVISFMTWDKNSSMKQPNLDFGNFKKESEVFFSNTPCLLDFFLTKNLSPINS